LHFTYDHATTAIPTRPHPVYSFEAKSS